MTTPDLVATVRQALAGLDRTWTVAPDGPRRIGDLASPDTKVIAILADEGNGGWDGSIVAIVPGFVERDTDGNPAWDETLEHFFNSQSYAHLIAHAPEWLAALCRENDRLERLLGSHADGHRCTCEMLASQTPWAPAEWEPDPWCPTHPDVDTIVMEVDALRARLDAADHLRTAAAAFLAAWRRGEDATHALDEADDLEAALDTWEANHV